MSQGRKHLEGERDNLNKASPLLALLSRGASLKFEIIPSTFPLLPAKAREGKYCRWRL